MHAMRIAMNVEQLFHQVPGGIGRYTLHLFRALSSTIPDIEPVGFSALHRKHTAVALATRLKLPQPPLRLPLVRPILYDSWHLLGGPPLPFGMAAGPRQIPNPNLDVDRDVDLVHAPSLAIPPKGKRPLVVTVHDIAEIRVPETLTRRGRRFHRQGLAAAIRHADAFLTVSHTAKEEFCEHTGIPADRVTVTHLGTDLTRASSEDIARVRKKYGLHDTPYILFLGTLEPRKNLSTLMEAFLDLTRETDLAHSLVVAGPKGWGKTSDTIATHARALGNRAILPGYVAETDLPALYKGADLFAFPSLYEGFGLPVIEAQAQGTPVVCSTDPALCEVTAGTGIHLHARDTPAWTATLADLLAAPSRREEMRASGLRNAAGFTWEACASTTAEIYRQLC